jgi:hypothetical protein
MGEPLACAKSICQLLKVPSQTKGLLCAQVAAASFPSWGLYPITCCRFSTQDSANWDIQSTADGCVGTHRDTWKVLAATPPRRRSAADPWCRYTVRCAVWHSSLKQATLQGPWKLAALQGGRMCSEGRNTARQVHPSAASGELWAG